MVAAMTRAIALAMPRTIRLDLIETLRSMVVLGCAAALILARQPLPL